MAVVLTLCSLAAMAGCSAPLVFTEKYEAEKTRALNFQRLLAQEEKRTGELDAELKRVKRDAAELEARTRELTAQLQAVREQFAKAQEDLDAVRQTTVTKARDEVRALKKAKARAPRQDQFLMDPPPVSEPRSNHLEAASAVGEARYHEVQPGETLFRIAKRYNVSVDKLKEWNSLSDNRIEVGQRLTIAPQ